MNKRYKIIQGSESAHCCFEFTVVDTTKPFMIGGKYYYSKDHEGNLYLVYEAICECFKEEDAQLIVDALNKLDTLQ